MWFEVNIKVITDKEGNKRYAIGKLKNVDKEKKEKSFLMEKASTDSMTKLLNHSSFEARMKKASKRPGTLIVIDIDDFKFVNDNYGHKVGDKVIMKVSHVIKKSCRDTDIVGRIGGDEFAVFLVGFTSEYGVERFCQRINEKMSNFDPMPDFKKVTLSIGCAITDGSEEYDSLFKIADQELYKVKEAGKGNQSIAKVHS